LRAHRKPANEQLIDEAADKLRKAGISMIPNIMVGLPGENEQTYNRTLGWLNRHRDIISHVNAYNTAIYDNSDLGRKLPVVTDADRDENAVGKSFHSNPEVHQKFADAVDQFSRGQLDRIPGEPIEKSEVKGKKRKQETCRCSKWSFPHRFGSCGSLARVL
jgi:hypothetical protein